MARAGVRYPVWLWPNLLSLDAPLIAVLWQGFLANCYRVPLRPTGRIALFLTVWAIYVGDRLLDARAPAAPSEAARHVFYREHRTFASVVLGMLIGLGAVTAFWLRPAVLHNGLIPFAAVLLYLAVLHITRSSSGIAKEPLVAFLFTAGTFLVAWTNDPVSPVALLWPAVAFFLLCLANLTAIEAWEWRELRPAEDRPHPVTAPLVRSLHVWAPLLAVSALVLGRDRWYLPIAISATLISLLVYSGRRLPIELRRVLVDGALLTPLLFLR